MKQNTKKGHQLQLGDKIELENGWKSIKGIKYLQLRGPIQLTLENGFWVLIGISETVEVRA